jgi:hypothetical protein
MHRWLSPSPRRIIGKPSKADYEIDSCGPEFVSFLAGLHDCVREAHQKETSR